MVRTSVTLLALALVAAACGAAPRPTAAPAAPAPPGEAQVQPAAPTRDLSKDGLPLLAEVHVGASAHIFQGGDDHVTLAVDNRGRDIQDLVIVAGPWLDEHGLAMGTTPSCNPDPDQGLIACGPIYSGRSANEILRAMPAHTGTFTYELRLYDREDGALHPIQSLDGRAISVTFSETVDPVTNQISSVNVTPPARRRRPRSQKKEPRPGGAGLFSVSQRSVETRCAAAPGEPCARCRPGRRRRRAP